MFTMLLVVGLAVVSGVLYRMGGWGDEGRDAMPWLPEWAFNTKARDVGCALCGVIAMWILFDLPWWSHLASFLLLFAALTTYWDFVFTWDNHWFHGFMCGIAYFPYAIASEDWIGFGVRCIALAISMGLVSVLSDNDVVEEVGRGSLIPLTIPLMFI